MSSTSPAKSAEPSLTQVISRLSLPTSQTLGALPAGIVAAVSAGLIPLLVWVLRQKDRQAKQKDQLFAAAKWVGSRDGGSEPAKALLAEVRHGGKAITLNRLAFGVLIWLGLSVANHYARLPVPFSDLLSQTYSGRSTFPWDGGSPFFGAGGSPIWSMALAVGFAAIWLSARNELTWLRNVAASYNVVAMSSGGSTLTPPRESVLPGAPWIVVAVILVAIGLPWGIFMALAGSAEESVAAASDRFRADLANRLGQSEAGQRVMLKTLCGTTGCRRPLPAGSDYCPHCGRSVPTSPTASGVS